MIGEFAQAHPWWYTLLLIVVMLAFNGALRLFIERDLEA